MVDAESETFDEAYLEALDNYIGAEIVLAGKDAIPTLDKVKKQKHYENNLPIGYVILNPFPVTCNNEL